ncbi:MAG: hypothetical protein V8Q65_06175 [Bacteroidaceae bacterium]
MGFDAYVSYRFAEAKTHSAPSLEQALTEWLRYKPRHTPWKMPTAQKNTRRSSSPVPIPPNTETTPT